MSNFYDSLETRNADDRQQELVKLLARQLAHAKNTTLAYGELLESFDCESLSSFDEFATYPITRK